ncbi:hypothetical protein NM688_g673 [Phlebia brevispora]|uniref:Uncharacterized protein n=1 Tax=Phlebia brevispora TaxID=194682 RepID=A0ACC1TE24_9APHY|nr:hypothetical protein NM688_g673 [Phlebia brevispora]
MPSSKHSKYYSNSAGTVVLLVEETLFRVSATVLKSESEVFASILDIPFGTSLPHGPYEGEEQGLYDQDPIRLEEILVRDFERLMDCLFDENFESRTLYIPPDRNSQSEDEDAEPEEWFRSPRDGSYSEWLSPDIPSHSGITSRDEIWPSALQPWVSLLRMADRFIVEVARLIAIAAIDAEPEFSRLSMPKRLKLACEAGAVHWIFPVVLDYLRRGSRPDGCIPWEDIKTMGLGAYHCVMTARESLQYNLRDIAGCAPPRIVTVACLRPSISAFFYSLSRRVVDMILRRNPSQEDQPCTACLKQNSWIRAVLKYVTLNLFGGVPPCQLIWEELWQQHVVSAVLYPWRSTTGLSIETRLYDEVQKKLCGACVCIFRRRVLESHYLTQWQKRVEQATCFNFRRCLGFGPYQWICPGSEAFCHSDAPHYIGEAFFWRAYEVD